MEVWKKRHERWREWGSSGSDCPSAPRLVVFARRFFGPFCIYRATTTRNQYSILCVYLCILSIVVATCQTTSNAGHDVRVKGAIGREIRDTNQLCFTISLSRFRCTLASSTSSPSLSHVVVRHAIMLRSLACRGLAGSHAHRLRYRTAYRAIDLQAPRGSLVSSRLKWYSTESGSIGDNQSSESTPAQASTSETKPVEEIKRKTASFYISNVLPIQVGKFEYVCSFPRVWRHC